jgi:hypothetical protein
MDARVADRLVDPKVAHDTRLLGDFTDIFCADVHGGRARAALESDGVTLGIYRKRVPVLCGECAEFMRYAEKRRALCPKDPKPFCVACDTHCYKSDMRALSREIMRHSGPKSWRRGYLVDGVKHALAMRRYKRDQARAASGGANSGRERA